jgi:predicted O-methyltransferase YrrM
MSMMTNPSQMDLEFDWFLTFLKQERVTSYLEVGSKKGFSLLAVGRALPVGSKIVSVDINCHPKLLNVVKMLNDAGRPTSVVKGDSVAPNTIAEVAKRGHYDACFIDANHSLDYVTEDFHNYSPMCRVVAFHDIGWREKPDAAGRSKIEVPILWDRLRSNFRSVEFRSHSHSCGIGAIWMKE